MGNIKYRKVMQLMLTVLAFSLGGMDDLSARPTRGATVEFASQDWQEFHSVVGKCKVNFPSAPEHISEKMMMPDGNFELKYDAYISALGQETIFMLLIAQYPDFVDEKYAQMSLEAFLNGVLTHNPGNQLIFADLVLVDGREALDFFIRTGNVYFKGRAMMVHNSLYLMAMECEIQNYSDLPFQHFIGSFQLND